MQSQFTDLSSSTFGNIVSWEWTIGEITSTVQNPGRVFTNPGSFDVCLTVTDDAGNQNSVCKEGLINVYNPPNVDFSFDIDAGCSPLEVNFNDLSDSPNGAIVSWEWGLGGTTGTFITNDQTIPISTIYENDGFKTITLIVTDDKGCTQSFTQQDVIQVEEEPEIIISTVDPIGCSFPMTVDFVNFGLENNVEYFWDFGNGETYVGYDPDPVTYLSQADYDVKITSSFAGSDCTSELILEDYISLGGSILFDFGPKKGCRGMEVQFEDQSPLDASTWLWDFGDGQTSSERDPIHRYSEAGIYTVSLFRDTGECSGTKTSIYQIEVLDNPVISADVINEEGCLLPADISFETAQEAGVNYTWVINDGSENILQLNGTQGTFTFDDYGNYILTLIASNSAGCISSLALDTVRIEPLKAKINGTSNGCLPFEANLSISTNSPNPISNVDWDIEGPWVFSEMGNQISFTVDQGGTYGASAIVQNELGCIDTVEVVDFLNAGDSILVDFEISDFDVCPNEVVRFTDLSTGDIDNWTWFIGDSLSFEVQDLATEINLPGTYDVSLEVESGGCTITKTFEDTLTVNSPAVNFQLEYNCEDPHTVIAIDGSVDSDQGIWKYVIEGDTTEIVGGDSISIELPGRGNYFISLEAFNSASGCSNISFDDIEITVPQANFATDKTEGCGPLEIEFTNQSKDAFEFEYFTSDGVFFTPNEENSTLGIKFGGTYEDIGLIITDIHGCKDTLFSQPIRVNGINAQFNPPEPVCFSDTLFIENQSSSTFAEIISYSWTLGDSLAFSTDEDAGFIAPEEGKFDLKLVVEDSWGCVDSTNLGLGAFFRTPNFELLVDTLACTTSPLRFRNSLHSAGYEYIWDFGDGNISNEINPLHNYLQEGEYEIDVNIVDDAQCSSNATLIQKIEVYDPIAAFTVDTSFAPCPPLIPQFTNLSENAIEYIWDFGDSTALESNVNPSHLYSRAGFYDVSLIAYRSENCQDTILFEDLIQLDGPRGDISFQVDSSCVPVNVNFEAILDEDYTMTWDFGDGVLEVITDTVSFNSISHQYLNAGTYIPKIILTNNENCTIVREGESIETHDLEAAFTLGDSVFCDGAPVLVELKDESFTTSPILNFDWQISGSENEVLTGFETSFTAQDTGISSVQLVVSSEYCEDTLVQNSILKIGNRPLLDLGIDTFVCIGNSITLSADSLERNVTYNWYDDIVLIGDLEASVSPSEDQYYIFEAINNFRCKSIDSVLVEVIDDQTRFAGEDRTICLGDSTEVVIDFSDEVYWPTILNCFECNTVQLSPDSSQIFPVIATNDFGCLVRDSILVDVLDQNDIDAGEDQQVCRDQTAVLLAYVPGNIEWSPSGLLSNPNDQLTTASVTESTLFTLTSTLGECTLRDSMTIEVFEKARLEVRGDTICYGETATLFAGGAVDNVQWLDDPTLSTLNSQSPKSNTTENRSFTVFGNLNGCQSDTASVDVLVFPQFTLDVPSEIRYFKGSSSVDIDIENPEGIYSFQWSPVDQVSCSNCSEINVDVNDEPISLTLSVTNNETGCVEEYTVDVRAFDSCQEATESIYVPNIFSPNGDGYNDEVEIVSPTFDDIENIVIFDRWGQKVFSSNSVDNPWDGRFGGDQAMSGVYTYRLSALCPEDNSIVLRSGDITLIR